MRRPKDVDAYLETVSAEARDMLIQLRKIIRAAAPKAVERISYGMPYYDYKGRLAYFRQTKNHIGLYIPPPVIAEHKRELRGYETATGTVRLPLDKKLPVKLIQKLIKVRMKKNEEESKNKIRQR